jgi:PAS domain S-box-containing protein
VDSIRKRKKGSPEDLLKELTELRSAISRANELAISGQAAIQALHESERQLSTLMSNLPGMVFRLLNDRNWTIDFVSEGCQELTGYTASDLTKKAPNYYTSIVHPEDLERLRSATRKGLSGKERIQEEYRIITASGEVKWVWEQSIGVYSEQGEVLAFEGFVSDITERVRTRRALQKSEQDLRTLASKLLNAQETERKRISQELHDSIGQLLGAINLGVETAISQIDAGSPPEAKKSLKTALRAIQSVADEVTTICNNLRPPVLDDIGISAAISWWCREFQTLFGIRAEVRVDIAENDVPDVLKIVIYRVLQESLNNVAKHSQADLVRVSLRKAGDVIRFTIEDDGVGFTLPARGSRTVTREGFGLASMKERVEYSGGSFVIGPGERLGTVIEAFWPIRPRVVATTLAGEPNDNACLG